MRGTGHGFGAFHTLVPRRHLEAIGIRPDDERTFEMADGTPITLDIAIARLDFLGEYGADVVVFGEGDVEPLLGVTALESAGMVVDPRTQRLTRLPILPLKASVSPELAGLSHSLRSPLANVTPLNHSSRLLRMTERSS